MKHVQEYLSSDLLDLITVSTIFREEPADWAPLRRMCGYLDLPLPENKLPESLTSFLEHGPPPIFFNLGALMKFDPEHYMHLVGDAIKMAGCRAVLHISPELAHLWPIGSCNNDGTIYYGGSAPNRLIFPRCSAVVHHGSPGTAHLATLCGRPSLVIGFWDEQMFWGKQLEKLGLAGAPVMHQNVTVEILANGIRRLLKDESLTATAKTLGQKMADENGVQKAIDLIHQILPRPGV